MPTTTASDVREVLEELADFDRETADPASIQAACAASARLRSWLDRFDALNAEALARRHCASNAEAILSGQGQRTRREIETIERRGEVLANMPELGDGLLNGEVSGAHLDAVDRAMRRLDPEHRPALVDEAASLAEIAGSMGADEFDRHLRREVAWIEQAAGVERLERQRRANRLRTWTDRSSGMLHGHFELDPETGLRFAGALRNAVEALFHSEQPASCPSDPLERHHHLQALALAELVTRPAGAETFLSRGQRTEVIVTIDAATLAGIADEPTLTGTGCDLELGLATVGRLLCSSVIIPALVDHDRVPLQLGREQRLASVHQRRALAAMYDRCAITGCHAPISHCEPHHVTWWRHGGLTDLDNLLPLCSRHHHCAHEGGWRVRLEADRTVIVTLPDGSRLTHAPPRR